MKLKYFLPVVILLLGACSDEDEGSRQLGPDQASAQINSTANQMQGDVVTLVQSQGVQGASSLINYLSNSQTLGRLSRYQMDENKSFVEERAKLLGHVFATGVPGALNQDEELWDFKGVYEWSVELQDFERSGESDILIVRFPTEGSTTNDAEFRLLAVEFTEIDMEQIPTLIQADLSVDGEKFIELDLAIDFGADNELEKADISLDVLPFSFELNFDNTQAQTSSLAASLLLEGANVLGIDVTVSFGTDSKIEPIAIEGEVSYRELRIVGDISDSAMDQSVSGDPNDYINLAFFIGVDKIGDIIFVLEEVEDNGEIYEDYVPYLQYADGSSERLEDILEPVIDEIDTFFEDLE